jgi:hypothetical protein
MNEEDIKKKLALVPGARRAADGVIVGDERGAFHITGMHERDEDLTPEESLFSPFCAKKEIIRLREIKSPHDYLLRFRAIAVVDSPRVSRVMSARRKKFERAGRIWSLSGYYDTLNDVGKRYVSRLPRRERKIARSVPSGFAPLAEANAICLKSFVGEVIIVSEALRYFYYFMTICLHGARYGINLTDRADAGLIGLRVMIGSEAQDFDIDPRGTLPARTEAAIRKHVNAMIEFTFGHEFAHLLLHHLPAPGSTVASVLNAEHKTYSHAQEYAADLHAVTGISADLAARVALSQAAYDVLLYLHLIELMGADHPDVPSFSVSATHPAPLDRLRTLRQSLGDRGQPAQHKLALAINEVRETKDILLERVRNAGRDGILTFYGSIYLHGLGGREREDRIEY